MHLKSVLVKDNMPKVERTFSQEVKEEVAINLESATREEIIACVSAFVKQTGSFSFFGGRMVLDIQTSNAVVARKLYQILRQTFSQITIEISVRKMVKLKRQNIYILRIYDTTKQFFEEIDYYYANDQGFSLTIKDEYKQNPALLSYYVQGLFLGAGSINNLHLASYHLELSFTHEAHALDIIQAVATQGIQFKIIKRRKFFVLYLKDSTMIGDLLAFMHANKARFAFEDVRITRDMMNSMNRLINCEVANEQKTQKASAQQIANIAFLRQTLGKDYFHDREAIIVKTRIQNPEASLLELSEHLYEQHNIQMSKSGLNHFFRKIAKQVEEIKKSSETVESE